MHTTDPVIIVTTKIVKNEHGIALVTALMLTLISLGIILSTFYILTQGIRQQGSLKRYRTALEAAHGGQQVFVKDIIPSLMRNYSSVYTDFTALSPVVGSKECFQAKLNTSTSAWPVSCSQTSRPKDQPDLTIVMPSTGTVPFNVYSKIVDTIAGNSDTSGLQLEGAGVAESVSLIKPQHYPYVYRVEIQGERSTNATEQSNISVLYAY